MVYCVVFLGLLIIGMLVGHSLNTPELNSVFWSAFSAIGSWIGGLAAATAAYIAVKIADRQISRDNYRITVYKTVLDDIPIEDKEILIHHYKPVVAGYYFHMRIQVANTGLRPIQINYLHFSNDLLPFTFAWPDQPILQPGCSIGFSFKKDSILVTKFSGRSGFSDKINAVSNSDSELAIAVIKWLYESEILLEVATGEKYLVAKR